MDGLTEFSHFLSLIPHLYLSPPSLSFSLSLFIHVFYLSLSSLSLSFLSRFLSLSLLSLALSLTHTQNLCSLYLSLFPSFSLFLPSLISLSPLSLLFPLSSLLFLSLTLSLLIFPFVSIIRNFTPSISSVHLAAAYKGKRDFLGCYLIYKSDLFGAASSNW